MFVYTHESSLNPSHCTMIFKNEKNAKYAVKTTFQEYMLNDKATAEMKESAKKEFKSSKGKRFSIVLQDDDFVECYYTEREFDDDFRFRIDRNVLRYRVEKGYKAGIVTIKEGDADLNCYGLVCEIGGSQFYFTNYDEETAEEYLAHHSKKTLYDEITNAIMDIYSTIEEYQDGEAMYYYDYLGRAIKNN